MGPVRPGGSTRRPLGRVDAAVNLAGAGVGDQRWDEEWKRTIVESRTSSTALLARTLASLDAAPAVLLQGSAIGYYGSRGEELLDESAPAGEEFLARACVAWEAAAAPARAAGIRTVSLRTGLVMAPEGGAFGQLLPLVKLGLGGPLGDGRSWWSWITLEDELRAIDHLLHADVSGPVNLVAPDAERNRTLITALAKAHHRPSVLPVPAFALRAALGEFAEEVLASRRLAPAALLASGFRFSHPDVASAVRWTGRSAQRTDGWRSGHAEAAGGAHALSATRHAPSSRRSSRREVTGAPSGTSVTSAPVTTRCAETTETTRTQAAGAVPLLSLRRHDPHPQPRDAAPRQRADQGGVSGRRR